MVNPLSLAANLGRGYRQACARGPMAESFFHHAARFRSEFRAHSRPEAQIPRCSSRAACSARCSFGSVVSARAQPAAITALLSSVPLASQIPKGRPMPSSPVIRQTTGASCTIAARALVAAAPQSRPAPHSCRAPGVRRPDKRTTRSLNRSVPPSTTATCAAGRSSFCWRGRRWTAPVRQNCKGNAGRNRRDGSKNQCKPFDLGLGQAGAENPTRVIDRQSWTSVLGRQTRMPSEAPSGQA